MTPFAKTLAALSVAVLAAAPVVGKPLSRILSQSGFTPVDLEMMIQAEAVLYGVAQPRKGTSEAWSNPDSAAYGKVTVVDQQGNCIVLQHKAHPKGAEQASLINRKFCKDVNGAWRLSI
jgi:surface antigen